MELYAFYREGEDLIAEQIAVLNSFRRNISARLPVPESHFPEGRPLPQIDGFLIRLPGSKTTLFWMASSFFFDVDISRLQTSSPVYSSAEPSSEETGAGAESSTEETGADGVLAADMPVEGISADQTVSAEAAQTRDSADTAPAFREKASAPAAIPGEEASAHTSAQDAHDSCADEAPSQDQNRPADGISTQDQRSLTDEGSSSVETPQRTVKKIQRSDISRLPRKFWPLANNSFLLHGYHNYNHLMLIEEGGRTWLGVPGIYAPQEARAADLFGFPRFTRSCASCPELTEEERSDSSDFGHWCRCVGSCRPR